MAVDGFNTHRLKKDEEYYAKEVLIAEEVSTWEDYKFNEIVYKEKGKILSKKEKRIMASTLQWLGTPIGKSFLSQMGFEETIDRKDK